jgi:RHS repeat-associated protein
MSLLLYPPAYSLPRLTGRSGTQRHHHLGRLFFLALSIFLSTSLARAQQTSLLDPTNQVGLPPGGVFTGSDFDLISTSNGNLHIQIPLVSTPGRGLNASVFYLYDNQGWSFNCTPSGSNSCKSSAYFPERSNSMGGQVNPNSSFTWTYSQTGQKCTAGSATSTLLQGSNYVLREPDGTKHSFILSTVFENNTTCNVQHPSPQQLYATDGSGWILLVSTVNLLATEAIRKDGTVVNLGAPQLSGGSLEDTNGNQLAAVDTLGRTVPALTAGPPNSNTELLIYSDSSGTSRTITLTESSVPVTSSFCAPSQIDCNDFSGTIGAYSQISFPNNRAYTFTYVPNSYAQLSSVTLPTGATISWTWQTTCGIFDPSTGTTSTVTCAGGPRVLTRTVTVGAQSFQWAYSWGTLNESTSVAVNSVTDPLGNKTVYTCTKGAVEPCQNIQYFDSSGNLIKTENVTFPAEEATPPVLGDTTTRVSTTTWNQSNFVTKVETDRDSLSFNNGLDSVFVDTPIEVREYSYGSGAPGSLLRRTHYTYLHETGSAAASYLKANIINRPVSRIVYDGSGNRVAETDYAYDDPARLIPSGITTQHGAPPFAVRGNLTSVSKWLNTGSSPIVSYTNWYDTGVVYQSIDPLSHTTTYAYSGTFAGAYPTTVTNALNQSATKNYDFNTGLPTSATDLNNLATTYSYDSMLRVSQVNHPDGGQDNITRQETTLPLTATLTSRINPSQSKIETDVFDGLGRITQHQLSDNSQGTIYTDTTYDALGRVATVSNPYRTGTDITTTAGIKTYGYDALSRKISETYPGNSVLTTAYCGPSTLVTDPTGKWRRSRVDGIGRLVEVDEPNAPGASVASNGCPGTGEPIWITSYTLDPLDNLTNILQNGSHARTFTYDSVSRLLTSTNPEVGTITYTYNPDSTLVTKADTRGITTTYTYDTIHRELTRTYSNGDPTVTTSYDQPVCLGLPACQNIGYRTSVNDAAGSEGWAYQVDPTNLRSVHQEQRTNTSSPSNVTRSSTYYLNLAGNITQVIYPTGRAVNYTYDSADRPSTATDGANGITYATGFQTSPGGSCITSAVCYTPQGTFYALSIGQTTSFTGLNVTQTYNSRLQPQEFKAFSSAGNAFDITYSFVDPTSTKNAGHVWSITNNLNSSRTQSFTYDQVNRILSAGTTATSGTYCWGYQYTYDAWANLTSQAGWSPNYTGCTEATMGAVTANGNNQISGFSYDAAGNTQSDGTIAYTYDAESQIKTAAGVTYAYDGDGRRVSKSNGKLYWYGSGGEILAETDSSGNSLNEYVFFGGKRIALISATGGTALPVQNASFEIANAWTNSCGTNCNYNGGPVPDWTFSGTGGDGSFEPNSSFFNLPLPDGNIVAELTGNLTQTLTGVNFLPNTTYTLSVYVGHRLDGYVTNYTVALQAGSTVLNSVTGSNSTITTGDFAQVTVTYTTGSTPPSGYVTIVLTSAGVQSSFDKVSLTTSGGIYYYVEDMLGTSRVMALANGTVCYDADFDPYGGEHPYTDTCPQNYKFEGKERDTETGNDDFGARYYTSRFGRWLSSDWSSTPIAVPYANLTNPQTLNLYAMVTDDPESFADLDGHCPDGICQNISQMSPADVHRQAQDTKDFFLGALQKAVNVVTSTVNTLLLSGDGGAVPSGFEINQIKPANEAQADGQIAAGVGIAAVGALDLAVTGVEGFAGMRAEAAVPDANVVVRGGEGEMPPQGTTFSGAHGATVEDAAQGVPHGQIRTSTAGDIRDAGGSVRSAPERTRSGNMNNKHVNIREGSKKPSTFSKPKPNPVPKKDRVQ